MSDSTAKAREPSMEDILASIRRIIDEEDTRDARPASDLPVDSVESGEDAGSGALPVMAAAPAGRDDDPARAEAKADGESVFPERESLFWSRATGRGGSEDGGEREDDEAGPRTDIFRRAQDKLGTSTRPGTRERIQSLAARAEGRAEQDGAHDRDGSSDPAETIDAMAGAEGRGETVAAFADADRADDREMASEPSSLDDSDVFDLTERLDHAEEIVPDTASFFDGTPESVDGAKSGEEATGESATPDPESLDGLLADRGDGHDDPVAESDGDRPGNAPDPAMLLAEDPARVDAGSTENGDGFHVSAVDTDADGDDGHVGTVYPWTGERDDDPQDPDEDDAASANTYSRFDNEAAATVSGDEAEADDIDTSLWRTDAERADDEETASYAGVFDTPARAEPASETALSSDSPPDPAASPPDEVDHGEPASYHGSAPDEDEADETAFAEEVRVVEAPDGTETDGAEYGETEPQDDTAREAHGEHAQDTSEEPVSAFAIPRDDHEEDMPDPSVDTASADAGAASGEGREAEEAYSAAFMLLDDQPTAGRGDAEDEGRDNPDAGDRDVDGLGMGDELGFSDTFSASDVYHDEPPALDDDYSRSLEDEEDAAAGFHADGAPRDDGMEKVGGLVRDAMERDPVDYADPSALVSMTSEEISARALASLADIEGEASRRMYGSLRISDDDGSESLEGMVRGMLRPLLREWLDDNLPGMVESAVRGEVERISAKSRRYSRASDED